MAWYTPDRPEERPLDPSVLGHRSLSGAVVSMVLCAIACAWILAVRWNLIDLFGPPWLWAAANLIAPYAGLALGGMAVLAGILDRLFGGFFETHLAKGFVALVLAVLVLWPRYAPTGMLVYATTETSRGGVRTAHCVYLRLDGGTEDVKFATARSAPFCPRFNRPE